MFGKRMYVDGVIMQPFTAEQLLINWEMFWDHEVTRFIHFFGAPSKEELKGWVEKIGPAKDYFAWGIFLEEDPDLLIGTTTLDIKDPNYVGETGISIFNKKFWKNGVATRSHRARTWWAYQYCDLKTIRSQVSEPNEGSFRALWRNGYCKIGTRYCTDFLRGKYLNFVMLQSFNPAYVDRLFPEGFPRKSVRKAVERTEATLQKAEETVRFG